MICQEFHRKEIESADEKGEDGNGHGHQQNEDDGDDEAVRSPLDDARRVVQARPCSE